MTVSTSGINGNFSQSKAKAKGTYISANDYTGIMAGDGGYDITIKGNTDLKGAIIASTDKAVQDGNNRLTTILFGCQFH